MCNWDLLFEEGVCHITSILGLHLCSSWYRAENNKAIENNFATMEEIEGKTFDLVRFLFASICFHYDTLDTYLYHEHKM